MKSLLAITGLTIVLAFSPTVRADLVDIDFNDGTGNGIAIDDFYASLGITFENARWSDRFSGRPGTSAPLHLDSQGPFETAHN